jgi:hypothetical protein
MWVLEGLNEFELLKHPDKSGHNELKLSCENLRLFLPVTVRRPEHRGL